MPNRRRKAIFGQTRKQLDVIFHSLARQKKWDMLKQPMIDKLLAMRLQGMAGALETQEQDPVIREPNFVERFELL